MPRKPPKGKNKPKPARALRANPQSSQSYGLRTWIAMMPYYGIEGKTTFREMMFGLTVNRTSNIYYMHPEAGPMIRYQPNNSYCTISVHRLLSFVDKITVAAWFINETASNNRGIVTKASGTDTEDREYVLRLQEGTDPLFSVYSGATETYARGTTSVSTNVLHHICGTYDGATISVYLDGILQDTTPASGNLNTNKGSLMIAGQTGFSNWLDGSIGDTRLYDRVLSADEVWQLFDPATRWDLYSLSAYASSGPGDLPLPPPPPANGNGASANTQSQRTGKPFFQI
jgi:hypothetical protein